MITPFFWFIIGSMTARANSMGAPTVNRDELVKTYGYQKVEYTSERMYFAAAQSDEGSGIGGDAGRSATVMDVPVKLAVGTAAGPYMLTVLTSAADDADIFVAGSGSVEEGMFTRVVSAVPVEVVAGVAVSGTVTGEDGVPLAGVEVKLAELDGAVTTTDENGAYRIGDLSSGTYTLTFAGGNYPLNSETVDVQAEDLTVNHTMRSGVAVTGAVRSYNPGNTSLQAALYAAGAEEPAYTAEIDTAEAGSGEVTQGFRFPLVAPGTYDLVVTKDAHLTYTVKGVQVGGTALDLTAMTDKAYSTIVLLAGDVNGDGMINLNDLNVVWDKDNYNQALSGVPADIDGSGFINLNDLNIIWDKANYNKSTADTTYIF